MLLAPLGVQCAIPHVQGGYTLERNFGEKYQKWGSVRDAAGHFEHYGYNMSVLIGTFLSTPSFPIEKKHLFFHDFLPVGAKIVWFNLTP
jgi:hypothetical protein